MSKRQPSVMHECITCAKQFKVYAYRSEEGYGKFCSDACRRSGWGYQLAVKAVLPATVAQIVDKTGINALLVRKIITALYRRGEAHGVCMVSSGRPAKRSVPSKDVLHASGPSSDPDMPRGIREVRDYFIKNMILGAMPNTLQRIADKIDLPRSTVCVHLKKLREDNRCHIIGWRRAVQGDPIARWGAGHGKDKPCNIVPMTQKERTARFLAKAEKKGRMDELRAYVYWQAEIKRLGQDIGGNLHMCHMSRDRTATSDTHLSQAYTGDISNHSGEREYMNANEVVEFLTETGCKYCLAAHHLIQKRKEARQKLGAEKRQITRLGKTAP